MSRQRDIQKGFRAEGRCITCGEPAVPSNPKSKRKSKDGLSPYCQKHLDAMNARARARNATRQIRKPAVRTGDAKLTMRMLNSHSKDCKPERQGWRWHIRARDFAALLPESSRAHGLIPVHKRSFWGDMRGDGYRFVLLVCNSTLDCPASALVRLEDIEFAAEGILD